MKHTDYVKKTKWFAWRPVITDCGKFVWLKTIFRTVDDRPLVYLGLSTEYTYSEY